MTSHSSPIAFLFPGQGSQSVGMGKELAALYPVAQETFDEADAALGYKLSQLCFEGPGRSAEADRDHAAGDSHGFRRGLARAAVEGYHAILRCRT